VFYRFKSQREPSRIAFDGTGISVWDLKKEIIAENKMGKGADFDFAIYNADTEEGELTSPSPTRVHFIPDYLLELKRWSKVSKSTDSDFVDLLFFLSRSFGNIIWLSPVSGVSYPSRLFQALQSSDSYRILRSSSIFEISKTFILT